MKLETSLHDIRTKRAYKALLHVSTFCYENSVKLRNFFYDVGITYTKKAPLPVVSIGNVAVGGTGKTPFTILLAKTLQSLGLRVAILSRGYRSLAETRKRPVIVSDGEGIGPLYPPHVIGDEAYLIAKNLPEAIVISGKDRFLGTLEAKKRGAQLAILDDGMQHRKLSRDIEIALVDGEENFQRFLPYGNLRDDPKRLGSVDAVITRRREFLQSKSNFSSCLGIAVSDRVIGIVDANGKMKESLLGLPVAVFCGIARPESFVKTVEECGTCIVDRLFLEDHEKAEKDRINMFAQAAKAKGAYCLLCTEKDIIKYTGHVFDLPLLWVKREMYIAGYFHEWNALIQKIRGLVI